MDVGASLSRADRGGCLSPEELLRVATVLKAARTAKDYAEGDAVESGLDIFFRQLTPNKFFEERIFTSILSTPSRAARRRPSPTRWTRM